MTLEHRCPNCQSRLTAPDIFAGRRVRCPSCAADVEMPQSNSTDDAIFLAEPVVRETPAAPAPQSEPRQEEPSAAPSQGAPSKKSPSAASMKSQTKNGGGNHWDIQMLDSWHGPTQVRQSYDPPADEPESHAADSLSSGPNDWMQRMLAAMLDPRSIQWLLTLGGGLMVLGGLIWLISWGALQNPLVVAVVLGVGSLGVLGSGWLVTLKTRYRIAGRAITFLGCIFVGLNLWFYHAQDLLPLDQGLWVAAAACVVIYAATVRVLRDPLFMYAVEIGVTLTAVLLLGNFGLALSATHLSLLLMVLALVSIHGRMAFPEGKEEFSRESYGMPLFWSGHAQLAAAVGVLFGAQLSGWVHSVSMFFDLPTDGILLTNSKILPGVLWLAAAYAYVYSDLVVRRVGAYMYLAAVSLIMAESTLIGLDAWGLEGMIGLLAVTSAMISVFAAAAPAKEERLARVVAPLALLIGIGPLLLGLWLHMASSSVIAVQFGFERETSWLFVGVMLLLAASNRISAYTYRSKAPGLAAVYLAFTAASLLIAFAGALNMTGVVQWQLQTPLLLLAPVAYLIASRLWRGHSPERPLRWIAHTSVYVIVLRALLGAVISWNQASDATIHLALAAAFVELGLFYGLARWLEANARYSYLAIAALCVAAWQLMLYGNMPADLFTLAFSIIGVTLLVASRAFAIEMRTVYSAGGSQQQLAAGPGAEMAQAGHALLSISLLSTVLKSGAELLKGGLGQQALSGMEWLSIGVAVVAALAGVALAKNSAWRRVYALAAICLTGLALTELNIAINLGFWRKAEILSILLGVITLGSGYVGRFREEDDAKPDELVSFCLWAGSLLTILPPLVAVFAKWNTTNQFSLPDEFAFIAICLLLLATGMVWRVKASTMLGGVSLAAYLLVLTVSVIYHPQVAVGIYLAAGGALLFGLGLVLAFYRDRLATIPERVAQRQGLFSVIAWR